MMTITANATQQNGARYTIIETDLGPLISESRVSVFDVMDAYDAGDSVYEIDLTFNLSPLQVETALDYIAEHRAALEPQLAEVKRQLADREAFYRRQAAEIALRIAALPMTPQREALLALRERTEDKYQADTHADRPERS
ncbi:MAG: hypothetical protein WAW03_07925 [Anaerolineae bacterium]|jgi:uncharacterized protein (DUF433 family)|uniref:hypothetical protein n=1 Tax=Candidatus Amarolinea dominans TaxID=3140696 RepID=UPI001D4292CD|nr:hypothetical protein [Anaerolineae bacterium]MBK7200190.1 hypothetical protein [Anaerolineae bacterium]MBK9094288.1 hypothetical protein [Anaerolineae bacterium]